MLSSISKYIVWNSPLQAEAAPQSKVQLVHRRWHGGRERELQQRPEQIVPVSAHACGQRLELPAPQPRRPDRHARAGEEHDHDAGEPQEGLPPRRPLRVPPEGPQEGEHVGGRAPEHRAGVRGRGRDGCEALNIDINMILVIFMCILNIIIQIT